MSGLLRKLLAAGLITACMVTGAQAQARPRRPLLRPHMAEPYFPRTSIRGALIPRLRMDRGIMGLGAMERARVRQELLRRRLVVARERVMARFRDGAGRGPWLGRLRGPRRRSVTI